jgi:hypothetical protein
MSYLMADIYASMPNYFSGRAIDSASCYENCRKAILELTENYKFPGLQNTGPLNQLTPLTAGPYPYNGFQQPGDAGLEINKFDSFFMYYNGQVPVPGQINAGFPLKFKTIDTLEILMNTPGPPTYWTRHEDAIYFAMMPDQAYTVYLRYQKEHPFPNAGTASASQDPILLPNSWQDIVELATAERIASDLDLDARRAKFQQRLWGDPKQPMGSPGKLGLIYGRTSQEERDQDTTTRAMRIRMRPIMR